VTRDYKLDLDTRLGAPILSVYGGKITTFRKLAEQAVDMLKPQLGFTAGAWTSPEHLPGGDIPDADFDTFVEQCRKRYAWMDDALLRDYARNYGTCIDTLVGEARNMQELGHHFAGLLYQAEVNYLITHEWARTAADILWRRSKKGLHTPRGTEETLQQWIDSHYDFGLTARALQRVS
jgi:glycerol-3-phosphate dehydrogenase